MFLFLGKSSAGFYLHAFALGCLLMLTPFFASDKKNQALSWVLWVM